MSKSLIDFSEEELDDLFHGCALAAFLDQACIDSGWPDPEATRGRAYAYYEAALADKNRPRTVVDNPDGRSLRCKQPTKSA